MRVTNNRRTTRARRSGAGSAASRSEKRGIEGRVRRGNQRPDAGVSLVDRGLPLDGGPQGGDLLGGIGLAGVALERGELAFGERGDVDAVRGRLLIGLRSRFGCSS